MDLPDVPEKKMHTSWIRELAIMPSALATTELASVGPCSSPGRESDEPSLPPGSRPGGTLFVRWTRKPKETLLHADKLDKLHGGIRFSRRGSGCEHRPTQTSCEVANLQRTCAFAKRRFGEEIQDAFCDWQAIHLHENDPCL